jgi:hypothetical protein
MIFSTYLSPSTYEGYLAYLTIGYLTLCKMRAKRKPRVSFEKKAPKLAAWMVNRIFSVMPSTSGTHCQVPYHRKPSLQIKEKFGQPLALLY